ncbi:ubiquitin-conjugating enzyme E2 N [Mucor velutinosus]|uniref:Propionyl-CoA carboxylase alpha chain, mitochondrial n=1 Tax=Mucor velutinosus TaxID=708070 RepID=A0AAN7DD60_9FUNG|nr:ubiquitin-conjugating enzyme E2 N [Mucor velutinosus]
MSKQWVNTIKRSTSVLRTKPMLLPYKPKPITVRPIQTQSTKTIPSIPPPPVVPAATTHTSLQKPFKKTFNKLLVANRGEIACRIIKTARKMGIKTVAVYSDLDANALHVQMADEAVHLGPASSQESYLSIPRILSAIQRTGAEAVHPGYGFLSENPTFVKVLEQNEITFVGPKASAIAAMGDKIQSKLIAKASGVHCIPGFDGEVDSVQESLRIANQDIGYPVMIKASAGGGGKGMRIAWNDKELSDGFKLAKQESKSSFGDDRMLIEKYIDNPRHIEVQVLGDNFGNVVYLPERECSIQRRNQKVIEESPSVHVDAETRRKMGEQAVALAKHVGYNSAGTVEFLVDSSRNFYFLEMNTRLQVEHPITEYVTGLDLVEQMLYSAANHPLELKQDQIDIKGWAFESRVYAEDPEKYLPSVGRLLTYQEPLAIEGKVRCDSGFVEGSEMHVEYDPLICKLATHGQTRQEALQHMVKALDEYVIKGVTHNIPLLRAVFAHPRFQDGKQITTHFLAEEYPNGFQTEQLSKEAVQQLAAVTGALWMKKEARNWQGGWNRPATALSIWVHITDEQSQQVMKSNIKLKHLQGTEFEAHSADGIFKFSTRWPLNGLLAHSLVGDTKKPLVLQYLDPLDMGFRIQYHGSKYKVNVYSKEQNDLSKYMKTQSVAEQSKIISSPMPGRIVSIAVNEGEEVIEGSELVVVEAMKMQNILRTPQSGIIKKIHVQAGHNVRSGQVLIEFQDEASSSSHVP